MYHTLVRSRKLQRRNIGSRPFMCRVVVAIVAFAINEFPSPATAETTPARSYDFKQVTIPALAAAQFGTQRVILRGTVRRWSIQPSSESPNEKVLRLSLAADGRNVTVLASRFAGLDFARLIESTVEVRGLAGAYRNRRDQFLAAVVKVGGDGDIRVIKAGPADPFETPLQPIGTLMGRMDERRGDHRVRTRGIVTFSYPGHQLYIQSGGAGVLVETSNSLPVHVGEPVEVVGFEEAGTSSPYITDATVKRAIEPEPPVSPLATTFANVLAEEVDARLIRLQGVVFDVVRRPTELLIVLQCKFPSAHRGEGTVMLGAYLQAGADKGMETPTIGSQVELTGVTSLIAGEDHKPKSFSLRLRDPRDYRLLKGAPWWNTQRALTFLAAGGAFFILSVVWLMSLRKQVGAQTHLIRATLESTADAILVLDREKSYVNANAKFKAMWQFDLEGTRRSQSAEIVELLSRRLVDDAPLKTVLSDPRSGFFAEKSTVLLRNDGLILECHCEAIPGSPSAGVVLSFRDITLRNRSERLERDRNRILEAISREDPLDLVLPRICRLAEDQDARLCCTISLLQIDVPVVGPCALDTSTPLVPHGLFRSERRENISGALITSKTLISSSGVNLGSLTIRSDEPVLLTEDVEQVVTATSQLTCIAIEHRRLFDQLDYLAGHDSLTGLLNRRALDLRLQGMIESAGRMNDRFGLLCIDLDRFKQINDTLSHRTGDLFIRAVAERLNELAVANRATIFRVGGDEFTVLCNQGTTLGHAEELANLILENLKRPFLIGDRSLHTSASIGISLFPRHGATPAAIQQAADSAMYKAKGNGKDQHKVFLTKWRVEEDGSFEMEAILRQALESSWFEMYYQPKLDRSGSVMGLEALIRLRHPHLGLISPDRFIAVAEDSGLIVQIGSWALNDVSRQISVWRARGVETGRVAVNVSAAQFARGAFLAAVEDVLARWQLPGDVLELELTESLLMNNIAEARDLMQRLRHLGINFAIDDFGTGYSSLAYLQSMPVSILKIDRTFVAAASSVDGRALLTSIIDLARSLRLTVVAEGVETEVQFNVLKELGCDQFQGFLFCRPQPAHQVEDFLSRAESRSGNDIGLVSDIVPGTPTIDLETLEIAGPVN